MIFSSDRSGVFNLYRLSSPPARPPASCDSTCSPAPSSRTYSAGRHLARLDHLFLLRLRRGGGTARRPAGPARGAPVETRPAPPAPIGSDLYPVRAYDPLETILPQTWFPYLAADRAGTVVGATVAGSDMVGRHAWLVSAGVGLESDASRRPASAMGTVASFPVSNSVWAPATARCPASPWARPSGPRVRPRRSPFPGDPPGGRLSFTVGYLGNPLDPIEVDPANAPEAGLASELQFTFGFGSTERPAKAISPEDGVGLQVGTRFGPRRWAATSPTPRST